MWTTMYIDGHPTQKFPGRVDVRFLYHELPKDIVLDGTSKLGQHQQLIGKGPLNGIL